MSVAEFGRSLEDSITATIIYADLFDFPLEPGEIWRDLIGLAASPDQTRGTIDRLLASGVLVFDRPYLVLPHRAGLAEIRKARRENASRLWPIARRLGALLGTIPFVRMVAVTGSLAAENPGAEADLDYLIITAPGRLWLARAMAVALVRLARPAGVRLCPNYLLSTRVLELDHQDLFTAHELLQAVPIVGDATYHHMLDRNRWSARWLPNRFHHAMASPVGRPVGSRVKRLGESALGGSVGKRLEGWEARRKRSRLGAVVSTARFTADVCEGHYDHHRQRVLGEFRARCEQMGIDRSLAELGHVPDRDDEHVALGTPLDLTGSRPGRHL